MASALVQSIKHVPPVEGEVETVVVDGIICSAGGCDSVALGDPPGEDLLGAIIHLACRSTLQ
jgi:predicted carbohydrate-binding protein with CBM5 and CBM33 domain